MMREIILAIVQGLTEFLPVSSSGHLALIQYFYRGLEETDILLDILLHVGTLFVVLIYYRHDIIELCRAGLSYLPFIPKETTRHRAETRQEPETPLTELRHMILLIIVGSIPTALIGILLKSVIEDLFTSLSLIGVALIITGSSLYLAEKIRRSSPSKTTISYTEALIVGTVQGIAICPGISRSGSTISAGIFLGIERKLAAKFSFLLSIPAVAGALLLAGKDVLHLTLSPQLLPYALAMFVAFITGYFAIHTLIKLVIQKKLSWFSWYCWILGLLACTASLFL
ncbi:MAG: undecaprenyl-diphosphate phosphatase [bacterium]|nr:undecaprenyl-diphosphate phosphatase [bacterium]